MAKPTTTLDFGEIFASQSPRTPYTWASTNYLRGWDYVGSEPPLREQFDALQKLSDQKDKYLFDYCNYLDQKTVPSELLDLTNLNLLGSPTVPTPPLTDNSKRIANTEFVQGVVANSLNSPIFTGSPTATTPALTDNSNRLATTAFVKAICDDLIGVDFNDNLMAGYIKFKNSLLFQWTEGYTDSDGYLTFHFATDFRASNTFNCIPFFMAQTDDRRSLVFNVLQDTRTKNSVKIVAWDTEDKSVPPTGTFVGIFAFGF